MYKRDKSLYIDDILDSANAIKEFTHNITFDEFMKDRKTYSATIQELDTLVEHIRKLKV